MAQNILVKSADDFVEAAMEITIDAYSLMTFDIIELKKHIGIYKIVKNAKKVTDIKKNNCFKVQTIVKKLSLEIWESKPSLKISRQTL